MQVSTNALARVHTQQGTRHFNRLSLTLPPSFSLATKTRTIESGSYKPDRTLHMSQTHRLLFYFSFFERFNVSKAHLSFDFYSKVLLTSDCLGVAGANGFSRRCLINLQ